MYLSRKQERNNTEKGTYSMAAAERITNPHRKKSYH